MRPALSGPEKSVAARVRWGTPNFLRINEFADEAAALAFAAQLQEMHADRLTMKIAVDRLEAGEWVPSIRRR